MGFKRSQVRILSPRPQEKPCRVELTGLFFFLGGLARRGTAADVWMWKSATKQEDSPTPFYGGERVLEMESSSESYWLEGRSSEAVVHFDLLLRWSSGEDTLLDTIRVNLCEFGFVVPPIQYGGVTDDMMAPSYLSVPSGGTRTEITYTIQSGSPDPPFEFNIEPANLVSVDPSPPTGVEGQLSVAGSSTTGDGTVVAALYGKGTADILGIAVYTPVTLDVALHEVTFEKMKPHEYVPSAESVQTVLNEVFRGACVSFNVTKPEDEASGDFDIGKSAEEDTEDIYEGDGEITHQVERDKIIEEVGDSDYHINVYCVYSLGDPFKGPDYPNDIGLALRGGNWAFVRTRDISHRNLHLAIAHEVGHCLSLYDRTILPWDATFLMWTPLEDGSDGKLRKIEWDAVNEEAKSKGEN